MRWLLGLTALLLCTAPALAAPCDEAAPCSVGDGEYYLALPPGWDGESPLPAIVFFHGHRSSGLSVINSGSIKASFGDHGYLLIAPNGALRPDSDVRAWPARPPEDGMRDDVAFTLDVVEDVAARVPLDRSRILVAGFSAGGSMAWLVACTEGDMFAGYVSVSGALRRPAPTDTCPGGPARMLHIHGFADTQVPLEGRGIRDWHQGDVGESLSLLRRTDQCRSNPDDIAMGDFYWCRVWNESCATGHDIEFCLHDGGHMMPRGWAELARAWFENGPGGS
ncbi:MAG: PHB depolymerase family esterase [Alphaproteobacteria bacterium]